MSQPENDGYVDGYVSDLTGADAQIKAAAAAHTFQEKPASLSPAPASSPAQSEPVILRVEDLHIRYRVRRPAQHLIKRFLPNLPGNESASAGGPGRAFEVVGLNGVSFTLRRGEHVGLVGMNGSGKTTLLRAVSGVLPPQNGHVHAPENIYALLNISSGFDNELSGYDNLKLKALYGGSANGAADEDIRDVMAFSGLGEFFFLPLKTYSAGMKARFALGAATLGRPDLLVMDEWVGAGDMDFRVKAHERLKRFVSSSGALLIASHSYAILQAWVTRLIWIHEGVIVEDGPRDAVFKSYADFLAANR
jgi:lipopolysaccharide transport system ATP-binding protein